MAQDITLTGAKGELALVTNASRNVVTGDGHPGTPRVKICTDPTIEPFDKIIECHLNAPRPKTGGF
jgi:hypothetical protein